MKLFRSSLRFQLLAWLLVPAILLLAIAGATAINLTREVTRSAYDEGLKDTVRVLASRVRKIGSRWQLDLPPEAIAILRDDAVDKVYLKVSEADGTLIYGDSELPWPALPTKEATVTNVSLGAVNLRMASMLLPNDHEQVLIQAAETYTGRERITRNTIEKLALPFLLILLSITAIVFYGISRGLRRLDIISEAVAKRSLQDLSRLDEAHAPEEVRPLVGAINSLLQRINLDIDLQRRFLSNAAHRLRTPLAGMKIQTELALREAGNPSQQSALQQLHVGLNRMSRLVKQLLSLARTEPGVIQAAGFSVVNLCEIARRATPDLVSLAIHHSIDLGFEGLESEALVRGESSSLQELIVNLLENAIYYTPAGGTVTLKIECAEDQLLLSVDDSGPGIPVTERQNVFERFYRMQGTVEDGTGLGLPIVKEIAQRHGGKVEISSSPIGGTCVQVRLPRYMGVKNAA